MATMNGNSSLWVALAVMVTVALIMPMLPMATDSDSLQDFCFANPYTGLTITGVECKPVTKVSATDFKLAGLVNAGNTNNANKALATPASVPMFPTLNTLGISAARIDFDKGGITPRKSTPKAKKILLLDEGDRAVSYLGFVSTSNTFFATVLKQGEVFVFPKGLVHFQLTVGSGPVMVITAFLSQNAGVQPVAVAFEDDEVMEKGVKIDEKTLDSFLKKFRK